MGFRLLSENRCRWKELTTCFGMTKKYYSTGSPATQWQISTEGLNHMLGQSGVHGVTANLFCETQTYTDSDSAPRICTILGLGLTKKSAVSRCLLVDQLLLQAWSSDKMEWSYPNPQCIILPRLTYVLQQEICNDDFSTAISCKVKMLTRVLLGCFY